MRMDVDLSHPIATVGGMGHIQVMTRIPVYAGDSLGFKIAGKLQTSPLRRNVVLDPKVDLCAFYVPCLLYTSPSPRDRQKSRMPSSA